VPWQPILEQNWQNRPIHIHLSLSLSKTGLEYRNADGRVISYNDLAATYENLVNV